MKPVEKQKQFQINRRQLLLATGLGGAGLFLPSLRPRKARAQNAERIKRLIIITTHHGSVPEKWSMLRGNPAYGEWEYAFDDPDPASFSEILRPLHGHRDSLLVVEGLSMNSALADKGTNNHNCGHLHALTGAKYLDVMTAGGPSVDQVIAKQVAVPGRIPSLELASSRDPWLGGMVNIAASQRAPVLGDPSAAFQRVFPPTTMQMTREPTEREKIKAAGRSVLDFVSEEYGTVAPLLGQEDRARLDMHRELVRDLEQRTSVLSSLTCDDRPAPPPATNGGLPVIYAMMDIIAAAMACDLTRVATLQIGTLLATSFGAPEGDVHERYAHQQGVDPEATMWMAKYNLKQAELFAYLLDALARYSEGDGTLLDNTAVLWTGELATGLHSLSRLPIVIAGSCAGSFRTGRYISFKETLPNPIDFPGQFGTLVGPGHSHLLVSLMQAMGLPDNSIGMPMATTQDGKSTKINLTGPLPRLT